MPAVAAAILAALQPGARRSKAGANPRPPPPSGLPGQYSPTEFAAAFALDHSPQSYRIVDSDEGLGLPASVLNLIA